MEQNQENQTLVSISITNDNANFDLTTNETQKLVPISIYNEEEEPINNVKWCDKHVIGVNRAICVFAFSICVTTIVLMILNK